MNRATEEKSYEQLSPFELKDKLIDMAEKRSEKLMLNAGRGNPNWVATEARHGFFLLGSFAMEEAYRVMSRPGLAGAPEAAGSARRLTEFCRVHSETRGAQFLTDALNHVTGKMNLNDDEFVGEMVDGILGDHYPTPDRSLVNTEKIIRAYLEVTMCDSRPPDSIMDIFLTEGGTAAMTYIFNTLRENQLLKKGDKIALGTPIFTPYLEIPVLNDYELVIIDVKQSEEKDWQYTDTEIEKLADPDIKAFFLVNPSNPSSVSIAEKSLQKIADLVQNKRKDLILLTDDVYGTFVNGFRSLAAIAPRNTILVYSYSKYFGATGWRLGAVGISRENVMDDMISALPAGRKKELHQRYVTISRDPDSIKFIDRLVADSRTVALNHTSGLSTPQQVMMVLFSMQELLDLESRLYRSEVQNVVRERYRTLYAALGEDAVELSCYARYYTTINVHKLALKRHGAEFAKWLRNAHQPIDFVWRLAEEKDVVLMDGGGFAAPEMSVRVSLANLNMEDYKKIGQAISELLEDYMKEWKAVK